MGRYSPCPASARPGNLGEMQILKPTQSLLSRKHLNPFLEPQLFSVGFQGQLRPEATGTAPTAQLVEAWGGTPGTWKSHSDSRWWLSRRIMGVQPDQVFEKEIE